MAEYFELQKSVEAHVDFAIVHAGPTSPAQTKSEKIAFISQRIADIRKTRKSLTSLLKKISESPNSRKYRSLKDEVKNNLDKLNVCKERLSHCRMELQHWNSNFKWFPDDSEEK